MSLAALAALLLGASAATPAADWQLIEVERDGGGAYLVDRASLRTVDDGVEVRIARVDRTDDARSPWDKEAPEQAREISGVIDCTRNRGRQTAVRVHRAGGTVVDAKPDTIGWTDAPLPPKSRISAYICSAGTAPVPLVALGAAFPVAAARAYLESPAVRATIKRAE